MHYFPYNWQITFTVHVPSLTTTEFVLFIDSQSTMSAQNIKNLKD